MDKAKTQIACPTCSKTVIWDAESPWRPFCSERCRLIDLGDWLDETNRIPQAGDEYSDPPQQQD